MTTDDRLARFEASLKRDDLVYVGFGIHGGAPTYVTYVRVPSSPTGKHADAMCPVTAESKAILAASGRGSITANWAAK